MYRIADLNITFKGMTAYTLELLKYKVENGDKLPDLEITCSKSDILAEKTQEGTQSELHWQITAYQRKLAEFLPAKGAVFFHAAVIDVDGQGVAFAAHSGVGKTTHMENWISYLGDKVTVVNGDKPIVRFFDDRPETPYAYGTPWCGKEKLGCNMRTELKHICFIERNEKNFVTPIGKKEAVDRIFNQVYMPKDPMAAVATMKLIDRLLSCCRLWVIHCNKDISSAETAYKEIFLV